ncbi:uncharacterized protein LOC144422265 [Styela clava]
MFKAAALILLGLFMICHETQSSLYIKPGCEDSLGKTHDVDEKYEDGDCKTCTCSQIDGELWSTCTHSLTRVTTKDPNCVVITDEQDKCTQKAVLKSDPSQPCPFFSMVGRK